MRLCRWALLLLVLGLAAASAHAEELTRPAPREWYGYQFLALDTVAAGAFTAGLVRYETGWPEGTCTQCGDPIQVALTLGSVGLYAFGGPTVHLAHRHRFRALASFGLRLGAAGIAGALWRTPALMAAPVVAAEALDGLLAFDDVTSARQAIDPEPQVHWGGGLPLVVGLGLDGIYVLGALLVLPAMSALSFLAAILAGPAIHFLRGELGRGFGLLGIELVVLPLAMLATAASNIQFDCHNDCGHPDHVTANDFIPLVGVATVQGIDAAFMNWNGPDASEPPASVGVRANGLTIATRW